MTRPFCLTNQTRCSNKNSRKMLKQNTQRIPFASADYKLETKNLNNV